LCSSRAACADVQLPEMGTVSFALLRPQSNVASGRLRNLWIGPWFRTNVRRNRLTLANVIWESALLAWTSSCVVSALVAASFYVTGCAGPNATAFPGIGLYPQGSVPGPSAAVQPDTTITATERAVVEPKKTQTVGSESKCGSPEACLARLKMLTQDPDRRWIRHPQSPVELASGVRLFAYAALSKKLTCDELTLALAEIKTARDAFRGSVPGIGPEKAASVTALNARVGEQLRVENAGRCVTSPTAR
jgi:hypothetical protein